MKDKIHIIFGIIIIVLLLVLILRPTTGKFKITDNANNSGAYLLDTMNGNTWLLEVDEKILVKDYIEKN